MDVSNTRKPSPTAGTTAGPVGVIGTGAIGTAVARVLLDAGRPVVAWNRTASRAAPAVEAGAVMAASPAEVLRAADPTIVCLTDYRAVEDVLDGLGGEHAGRTVVVLCTGSPSEAFAAHRRATARGIDHLDGGVQAGPESIGTTAGTILLSGSEQAWRRHADVLALLGGVEYVSADPTAAAVWDLALFGVWYDAQLGLLRALDVVAGTGSDVTGFARAAAAQVDHVAGAAAATAREVADRSYPPGPAGLAEHLPVLDRLVQLRSGTTLGCGGLDEVRAVVARQIDDGRAGDGLSAVLAAGA